jgi:FkbM family methyltransferase
VALPDGTRLWAPNDVEPAVLYHELGEEVVYGKHGLTVHDGDCIFDVGANIGLYSVLLLRAYRRLRVFAFEPVRTTYHLLDRNLALYSQGADVRAFDIALGRTSGVAEGEVEVGLSFAATLRPHDVLAAARRDASVVTWTQALLADLSRSGQLSPRSATLLRRGLDQRLARIPCLVLATLVLVGVRLRAGGFGKRRFRCRVRTLAEVLDEFELPRIDLLKIDVEGSEWEVLAGLQSAHWPRIRQLVVEVHDVEGRVAAVAELLRGHGFSTAIDQEDWALHPLLGLATVYGRRADV